jgi:hypothetical protein
VRETTFDLSGNLLKEVTFGGFDAILKQRDYNQFVEYKDGQTVEYNCEEFVSKDTLYLIISTYKFNPKQGIETQTKYESDSLIRFIKEIKKEKNIRRRKFLGFSFPSNPNYEEATVITDTTYFDKKNRIIKRVSFSSSFEKTTC